MDLQIGFWLHLCAVIIISTIAKLHLAVIKKHKHLQNLFKDCNWRTSYALHFSTMQHIVLYWHEACVKNYCYCHKAKPPSRLLLIFGWFWEFISEMAHSQPLDGGLCHLFRDKWKADGFQSEELLSNSNSKQSRVKDSGPTFVVLCGSICKV